MMERAEFDLLIPWTARSEHPLACWWRARTNLEKRDDREHFGRTPPGQARRRI